MRIAGWLTKGNVAGCLVMFFAAPYMNAATLPWQQAVLAQSGQKAVTSGGQEKGAAGGSGKPDASAAPSGAALPDAPEVAQSQSNNPGGQSGGSQATADQQQNGPAKPVGTAAAPSETTTGIAASRPAGAVIAPAKQRRVRAILISVGVLVGAGVALGTVAALSHSSPSQPK
jgi:hypothetical protein